MRRADRGIRPGAELLEDGWVWGTGGYGGRVGVGDGWAWGPPFLCTIPDPMLAACI